MTNKPKHKYAIVVMMRDHENPKRWKRKKIVYSTNKRTTIHEKWRECKAQTKPLYCAENRGRSRAKLDFKLLLIYPKNRWTTNDICHERDELGRLQPLNIDSEKNPYQIIKESLPWWEPEKIYDAQQKKHIFFEEMLDIVSGMKDNGTIYTLNNKVIVHIDNDVWVYQNKNVNDTKRLFILLRDQIYKKGKTNFIFNNPTTVAAKKYLYDLLVDLGYKRTELLRHYSY
jgi:hypothetical protein